MALRAVTPVAGEYNLIEIEYSPCSIYGEVACQIVAGMDTMYHEPEINRLGWYLEWTAKCCRDLVRDINGCRVVAEFAVLSSVVPVGAAMETKILVALVTVGRVYHLPTGYRRRPISGGIDHRID